MEKNIFEGAKFGDKFITNDGRVALYVEHNVFDNEYPHSLLVDRTFNDCIPNYDTLCFANNGSFDLKDITHPLNIVARYQEPIDKLDELAENMSKGFWSDDLEAFEENSQRSLIYWTAKRIYQSGIMAGYRKAKE